MPASTSTSKAALVLAALTLMTPLALIMPRAAHAQGTPGDTNGSSADKSRTDTPEDEDYSSTPYTRYGDFNSDKDEEEDTEFFQNGRFFGVAVGGGYEAITGNRGQFWQGGFPLLDFKLLYWFSFNFAMDMDLYYVSHYYLDANATNTVALIHLGLDLRYSIETKDLSSAISFANPYFTAGVGAYSLSTNSASLGTTQQETDMGGSVGFGFEFTLNPRKVYLDTDVKVNYFIPSDTYAPAGVGSSLSDLTGLFVTFTASFLFTW